jgi:hypothetical protein
MLRLLFDRLLFDRLLFDRLVECLIHPLGLPAGSMANRLERLDRSMKQNAQLRYEL